MAPEASGFTRQFEPVAPMLAREMPVQAAARQMAITGYYVGQALERTDLVELKAVAFNATASKRGHISSTQSESSGRRCSPPPGKTRKQSAVSKMS